MKATDDDTTAPLFARVRDYIAATDMTAPEAAVLLAYALRAHPDGTNAFPSVDDLVAVTKYKESAVYAARANLRKNRQLIPTGRMPSGTPVYRIASHVAKWRPPGAGGHSSTRRHPSTTRRSDLQEVEPTLHVVDPKSPEESLKSPAETNSMSGDGEDSVLNGAASSSATAPQYEPSAGNGSQVEEREFDPTPLIAELRRSMNWGRR